MQKKTIFLVQFLYFLSKRGCLAWNPLSCDSPVACTILFFVLPYIYIYMYIYIYIYTHHSIKVDSLKVDLVKSRSHHENLFFHYKKAPAGMLTTHFFFHIKKAPAGMLTTQECSFSSQKGPCGHADNAKTICFRKKSPCGHVDNAKTQFFM